MSTHQPPHAGEFSHSVSPLPCPACGEPLSPQRSSPQTTFFRCDACKKMWQRPAGTSDPLTPWDNSGAGVSPGVGQPHVALDRKADDGHWVTINGAHILIRDSVGSGNGFTRAALERKLVAHHKEYGGAEAGVSDAHRDDAGHDLAGESKFTFHKALPAEVKTFIEGHPEARRLFQVSHKANDARGADALAAMGDDAYFRLAGYAATGHAGTVRDAVAFGHSSPDPEHQFLAAVHDNLPPKGERSKQGAIAADKLRAGQAFTIHGSEFRVLENEDGYRVLSGPPGFPADVPVDALSQVPVDRGSLRSAKKHKASAEVAPFSRAEPYYLSTGTPTDAVPVLTLGQGRPTHIERTVGGVVKRFPVSYVRKRAITAGRYVHPATGQRFEVTADRMDRWVRQVKAMVAAKREIPAPAYHTDDARANLGWVIDAARDGDAFNVTMQVIGDDGAMAAARNACSVKINPDYRDEFGEGWGEVIEHCAFTPKPVISGLGGFEPIAASRDAAAPAVFILSADPAEERIPAMEFAQLRDALGSPADVPDDKLLDKVKELRTQAATNLSRATAAEDKVKSLDTQVVNLSRKPAEPDPEALQDRAELTIGKIDLALSRGDLTPYLATKLKGMVVEDNKPVAFMLSRADGFKGQRPVDAILGLLDGAKLAPKPGEVQMLARPATGEPGDDAAKLTAARSAELIAAAGYHK